MKYLVYKITNIINGKIYIGVHKTENVDDGYLGSGKHLKRAVKKYGDEYFEKEILAIFDNSDDMFRMESEIVNEGFVSDKNTYNLKLGGFGGFDYINSLPKDDKFYQKQKNNSIKGELGRAKYRNSVSYEDNVIRARKAHITKIERYGNDFYKTFLGKSHTEETKQKISETKKRNYVKEKHSGFGTCWIYNVVTKENKKINKTDINLWLDTNEWIKGRWINKK